MSKEQIKEKRPTLSDSSITTYHSILKNLHKNVFGGDMEIKDFSKTDPILKYLKDSPASRRKTILSALVIITDKKEYRDQMLDDIKEYNADTSTQEKTEKQKESWIDAVEVKQLWDQMKTNVDLIYKKATLTPSDMQTIQSFIIVSLLGGVFVPPRRSKDLVDWKIANLDRDKDNYLDKNTIHFNSYKTAKTYGQQTMVIPIQLKNILNKWIKVNPTDYLLFDSNRNPLTSVKLNQRLNKIFAGKKVGVNQLRKTYLTGKYAETAKQQKEMAKDMSAMGSSSAQEAHYVKVD
jgi:integrase